GRGRQDRQRSAQLARPAEHAGPHQEDRPLPGPEHELVLFPPDAAGLEALARRCFLAPLRVEALAGDVGRRRYFRLNLSDARSAIGVLYPPEEEGSRRRWNAARARLDAAVRVPAVLADDEAGHQIVEDLGAEDLAARWQSSPAERPLWVSRA